MFQEARWVKQTVLARDQTVRGPLTHMTPEPVASQHNFIVQPLVTKEWNARIF